MPKYPWPSRLLSLLPGKPGKGKLVQEETYFRLSIKISASVSPLSNSSSHKSTKIQKTFFPLATTERKWTHLVWVRAWRTNSQTQVRRFPYTQTNQTKSITVFRPFFGTNVSSQVLSDREVMDSLDQIWRLRNWQEVTLFHPECSLWVEKVEYLSVCPRTPVSTSYLGSGLGPGWVSR